MKVELFILNYNGQDFIVETIRSIEAAITRSTYNCKLIVIDNASTDGSLDVIQHQCPDIEILALGTNRVLCAFNDAAKKSKAEILFFLNSDLGADPNFIDPMVNVFSTHIDTFQVAAKSYLFDGTYEGGHSIAFMNFGHFGTTCHFPGYESEIDKFSHTFSIGFGAFHRERFLALGGFDELYLPGRLEDADISFRAWRNGWRCFYEPKSILFHSGSRSFKKKFGIKGTMELAHKNTFLFIWKNIHDFRYWIFHWLFLIPRLFWFLIVGQPEFVTGFLKAIPHMSKALEKRAQETIKLYPKTDREVFQLFCHVH